MVTSVKINDNTNSAVRYICEVPAFSNGKEWVFKPGINIIVGENGSGKTTLLEIIRRYLLVDFDECGCGMFNNRINMICKGKSNKGFDGVDVYADYKKNTFRLCHKDEKSNDDIMTNFNSFGTFFTQATSSTGESVSIALSSLFEKMFSQDAKLTFDYDHIDKIYDFYIQYVKKHRIKFKQGDDNDRYTILMDEPDRNLSIQNIDYLNGMLSYDRPDTQVIATIHNPLLIYSLSNDENINIIEMSEGYVETVKQYIDKIINKK